MFVASISLFECWFFWVVVLGSFCAREASLGSSGAFWVALGGFFRFSGALLGSCGNPLGSLRGPMGVLGASLGGRVAFWLAPGAGSVKIREFLGGI